MTPQKLLTVTLHHLQIDLGLSFKYLAVTSTKLRGGKKKDFVFSSMKKNPLFFFSQSRFLAARMDSSVFLLSARQRPFSLFTNLPPFLPHQTLGDSEAAAFSLPGDVDSNWLSNNNKKKKKCLKLVQAIHAAIIRL